MNTKNNKGTADIEYPCSWLYTIIGTNTEDIRNAVHDILGDRPRRLETSRTSVGGKYVSVNLTVIVHDETTRHDIYLRLMKHPSVKIIL